MTPDLSADEARRRWDYDPETGLLRWKISPARNVKVGDVAGGRSPEGYMRVKWNRKSKQIHRLAWLIFHGIEPDHIDHINGVKDDNRIVNLRCVSHRQNHQNRKCHRSGHLPGTTRNKKSLAKPWQAKIYIAGKLKHLGCFGTQREAHEAYTSAAARALGTEGMG